MKRLIIVLKKTSIINILTLCDINSSFSLFKIQYKLNEYGNLDQNVISKLSSWGEH